MNPFSSIMSVYNTHWYGRFQKEIEPLKRCFGIDICGYTLVNEEGKYFQIFNYPELCDYYYDNKFYRNNPFHFHPSNYKNGSLLPYSLNVVGFQETHDNMQQSFGVNANYLMIHRRRGNFAHCFSMSTRNLEIPIVNIYLNNLRVLERFADHFLDEWNPENGLFDPFSLNMPDLIGKQFYKDYKSQIYQSEKVGKHAEFLKELKLLGNERELYLSLTNRERQCLNYILEGYTAAEIGEIIDLSRRTVEQYTDNLKGKLQCYSKSELYRRFYELKIMGLLHE